MAPTMRAGLRRLGAGLIAYGITGLLIAVLGLVALQYVGGRVGRVADRITDQVESIAVTLDQTAAVLADTGTSASSFALTLERTPPAVRQTAQAVANLRGNLSLVQGQLGAINILGSRPLANAADLFGQMASDLDGLDGRLAFIATDLETNKAALLVNSASLRDFGLEIGGLADDLRGGVIQDSFADLQVILTAVFVVLVAWTAIPALGALVLGWWILRQARDLDDARHEMVVP